MSTSTIQKTIARQQQKILEGSYYEAHQQLRVIASRYIKSANYPAALEILSSGSLALLQAGQGGSGGDLAVYLVEVLEKGEIKLDAESRGKVLGLLRAFPRAEPTKKKFVDKAVEWSARVGDYENGDAEIHHVAGVLYAEECEPYEAEKHLALGTRDSPSHLAKLEYIWYTQDSPHTAALYCARAVFPYLLLGNLRSASTALLIFQNHLTSSPSPPSTLSVSSTSSDLKLFPALPLMNFLSLLLLAIQRGGADLFRTLGRHYKVHIEEVGMWDEALGVIAETYFGISRPRQGNPLFDMMGNMFFGGGGGSGSGTPKSKKKVEAPPAPPVADLD